MKTILLFLFSCALLNVQAQIGSLDLSYGVNGIRVFQPDASVGSVLKILPLANGGYYQVTQLDADFIAAVKYTPAGTIDHSYGSAGYSVSIPIILSSAIAQEDGKLIFVGITTQLYYSDFHHDVMIARLTTSGSLDASFYGTGIIYESATQTTYDDVKTVLLENNNLLVGVTSATLVGRFASNHFLRYDLATGTRSNILIGESIPLENWYAEDFEFFYAMQGTKTIVLSRGVNYFDYTSYQTLSRYNADGSLDNTFGGDGSIDLDPAIFAGDIKMKALGEKVLLARSAPSPGTGNSGLFLARFNNDGSPDLSFNLTGTRFTEFAAGESPVPADIEQNGERFIVGATINNIAGTRFLLQRYNANGSPDNSFDTDGRQTTGLVGTGLYLEELSITGNRLAVFGLATGAGRPAGTAIRALYILENIASFGCVADKVVNTKTGSCSAVVTGVDPLNVAAGDLKTIKFTLTGATTGTGTGSVSGKTFNTGITTVTYSRSSPAATCSFKITVSDKELPVISNVSSSPANIWPANDKLINVTMNYLTKDNCGIGSTTLTVTSNEPDGTGRRGDIPGDIKILSNRLVQLRAESWEKVSKRYYTITITTTDLSGNKASKSHIVRVSKSAIALSNVAADITEETPVDGLQVKVLPNPATNYFTIVTNSNSKEKITMRIRNSAGSLLEQRSGIPAKGQLQVGQQFANGIYVAEFIQGSEKIVVRLVKIQ